METIGGIIIPDNSPQKLTRDRELVSSALLGVCVERKDQLDREYLETDPVYHPPQAAALIGARLDELALMHDALEKILVVNGRS